MKNHIAEELPARKFAPAAAGKGKPDDGGDEKKGGKTPEERIRQAVYDIRYRARREEIPLTQAFSQYMQNSNMSQVEKSAVRKKLAGKDGAMKEDYQIEDLASTTVAKALFKVFVEGVVKEEQVEPEQEKIASAKEIYFEEVRNQDRKYKVRVTGTDGRSYVRYATREKINQLRANPNIKEVEMTQYGEPYEGERKRGEQTAKAKSGKGLDPVGKEDGDIDNDGDKDKTDSYLLNRRQARGAAIAKRKDGVSEEFLGEVKKSNKKENEKIDVMKGTNPITVNPPESKSNLMAHTEVEGEVILENGYSKFLGMLQEKKMTSKEKAKEKRLKKKYDKSGMKASMKKQYGERGEDVYFATIRKQAMKEAADCGCEDDEPKLKKSEGGVTDSREIPTKINLMKNKLRAMGLKMSYEPEGEDIQEVPLVVAAPLVAGGIGLAANAIGKGMKKFVDTHSNTKSSDYKNQQGIGAAIAKRRELLQKQSYELEGEVIDELRRSEKEGVGSPEKRVGTNLVGARQQRRERGEKGGRHYWSGGQGGSRTERGVSKGEEGSQQSRLNPQETSGKYLKKQERKRGSEMGSRFD